MLSDDGACFVIKGQKKVCSRIKLGFKALFICRTKDGVQWITGGMYAQYFLTLVKESSGDFTLVVVPRVKGVSTRHMEMSGSTTAGTAFVEFDEIEVPLDMVVGERGKGFKYIVSNFNHEVRLSV